MRCEKSFITIKLIWYGYLVSTLDIYIYEIPTETDLNRTTTHEQLRAGTGAERLLPQPQLQLQRAGPRFNLSKQEHAKVWVKSVWYSI